MNPWCDESVAAQQFDLARSQLERPIEEWPDHFHALVEAVESTQYPGSMVEVGCASGYNLDVLRKAGVEFGSYSGIDISEPAVKLAEARGIEVSVDEACNLEDREAGIVLDGSCLLHVEKWREHIADLCRASSRWVILHRVPLAAETRATATHGYGRTFPAWEFARGDLDQAMEAHGFEGTGAFRADGGSVTLVYARPRHYATYCDRNYLPRLKALYASMKRHCGPFRLHVLAWDAEVLAWAKDALGPANVTIIDDFLDAHIELRAENLPGPPRSCVEQMWTCGPRWVLDVMCMEGEPVTYVDADLFSFSSLEPMFAEIGNAPAGFVGHNFARAADGLPGPTVESHGMFGRLNVGVCYFADREIAGRWSDMCRIWCLDRVVAIEETAGPVPIANRRLRYADQSYLSDLVEEFPGIHVVENVAAMVGPWNVHTREWEVRDGVPYFGGRPLGLFHFSSLKLGPHGHWSPSRPEYGITDRHLEILYRPYLDALEEAGR